MRLLCLLLPLILGGCGRPGLPAAAAKTGIDPVPWNGWSDALKISNGVVEAIVVPSVGRIMEFRRVGETAGPFWHEAALHGQPVSPDPAEWRNFGGDKTWPAPQEAWPQHWPRAWPPPVVFDQSAMSAVITGDGMVLSSALDEATGLRCRREIALTAGLAEMVVRTEYQKVSGDPVAVSPWVITQLDNPQLMAAPVPPESPLGSGWVVLSGNPRGVEQKDGMVMWTRHPAASSRIGMDGSRLIWVGAREVLVIDAARQPGAEYPDKGTSTQFYTNAGAQDYVELETLGPLVTLRSGESCAAVNRYRLRPREAGRTAAEEAVAAAAARP